MNVYAKILVEEAERRGIQAEIVDDELNLYRLNYRGKKIMCWESLTECTSALAYAICSDKHLTLRVLHRAGLSLPGQVLFQNMDQALFYLEKWGSLVVKSLTGEQGKGVTVDVRCREHLEMAIEKARKYHHKVIIEEYIEGHDVRIIVINHQFVAAIERKPATIMGDGIHTIYEKIKLRNEELWVVSEGESQIPLSEETKRVIEQQGYSWDDVLEEGKLLQVQKTANYHTGGTIRDVTDEISPYIREIAIKASQAINIPVVGLDLIMPDIKKDEYYIIEANERPGLANHEPQPTAQRFIDFLFPETREK